MTATYTNEQQGDAAPELPEKINIFDWLASWGGDDGGVVDDSYLAWQEDALCAQTDPELFFPERGGVRFVRKAKSICGDCTVRDECLEYALANDERFGVWGGKSERERNRMRKERDLEEGAGQATDTA